MAEHNIDITILGGGIAGLWVLARLKAMGYDALLLEKEAVGGVQTIASQGIIHSGLKYALAGKVNALAQSISAMPEVWRDALAGKGAVDLQGTNIAAESQQLLIPKGIMGSVAKFGAKQFLGEEVAQEAWPEDMKASGFEGSMVNMGELVLDIPSVVQALTAPYQSCIRQGDESTLKEHNINAKMVIHTSAAGNKAEGAETQHRPLLMAMMKPAPFPLWAHLVGASEKPVATITTHKDTDGTLVWYLGGGLAERAKEDDPAALYKDSHDALTKYLPGIDLSHVEWAALPIDRVEGRAKNEGWMPDTPTLHKDGNHLYGWPTKLTFAPMLADRVVDALDFEPSNTETDWSFLPEAPFATPPWNKAKWTSEN